MKGLRPVIFFNTLIHRKRWKRHVDRMGEEKWSTIAGQSQRPRRGSKKAIKSSVGINLPDP
jgi:hypothetical protein